MMVKASSSVSDWPTPSGGPRSMESRSHRINQAFDSVSFAALELGDSKSYVALEHRRMLTSGLQWVTVGHSCCSLIGKPSGH